MKLLTKEYYRWSQSHPDITEEVATSLQIHKEDCEQALELASDFTTFVVWKSEGRFPEYCLNTFDFYGPDSMGEQYRLRKIAIKLGAIVMFKPDFKEYIECQA